MNQSVVIVVDNELQRIFKLDRSTGIFFQKCLFYPVFGNLSTYKAEF